MNNENANERRSNTPLLIIGLVLVIALLGGWWFYSSSKAKPTANTGANANEATLKPKNSVTIPPNAPPGAQPPHQQGSPSAMVTIEEFADYQCPQCALAHPIMNEIKSMYGTRINFIFREYPLDIKAHDKSYDAAVAAEAAGLQGKFWDMQNMLFLNQKTWTDNPNARQIWKDYAQKIGLDVNKWENDIAGMAARIRVDEDKKRGKAIGITGTPTVFINGAAIELTDIGVMPIKRMIDAELQKTAPSQGNSPANAKPAAD
jgi:protein-disulfide isomerase